MQKDNTGYKKAAETRTKKFLERDPDHFAILGGKNKGKKPSKPRGFAAMTPEQRAEAGRKGALSRGAGTKAKQKERSDEVQKKIKKRRSEELDKIKRYDRMAHNSAKSRANRREERKQKQIIESNNWDGNDETNFDW